MKVIDLVQNTDEWLEWRKTGLTASDAAVLLGTSPYKTPYQLWQEKTGRVIPPDLSNNPFVQWGNAKEPSARIAAEEHFDEIYLPALCAEDSSNPILKASFDAVRENGEPVELKCPQKKQFNEVKTKGKESDFYKLYYPQVQFQICVSGAKAGYLVVYSPKDNGEIVVIRMNRDDYLIDEMVNKANDLWQCIESDIEPTIDYKRDLYVPRTQDDMDSWQRHSRIYSEYEVDILSYKEKIKQLQQKQDAHKQEMLDQMGEFWLADYCGIKITEYEVDGRVDYSQVILDNCPDVELNDYIKESSIRCKISVSKEMLQSAATAEIDLATSNVVSIEKNQVKAAFY
jgi:putative phage-type endonuclease